MNMMMMMESMPSSYKNKGAGFVFIASVEPNGVEEQLIMLLFLHETSIDWDKLLITTQDRNPV